MLASAGPTARGLDGENGVAHWAGRKPAPALPSLPPLSPAPVLRAPSNPPGTRSSSPQSTQLAVAGQPLTRIKPLPATAETLPQPHADTYRSSSARVKYVRDPSFCGFNAPSLMRL